MTLLVPDITNGSWRFTLPGNVVVGETPFLIDDPGPQLFGAPDLRRSVRPRPGDHGVLFVGPDLYGSNKIVLPIVVLAADEEDAVTKLNVLAGACAPAAAGVYTQLRIDGGGNSLLLNGRYDPLDAPLLDVSDFGIIRATITFEASDPRYLGVVEHSLVLQSGSSVHDSGHGYSHGYSHGYDSGAGTNAARGVVVNVGNAEASAVIVMTGTPGSINNPALHKTVTQETLGFIISISAASYLVTDTSNGRVLLSSDPVDMSNAANRANALDFPNNADMLRFPPGNTDVAFTAASGQGTCTIKWHDTWLY